MQVIDYNDGQITISTQRISVACALKQYGSVIRITAVKGWGKYTDMVQFAGGLRVLATAQEMQNLLI